jgi:hypothetical protein
MSYLYRLYQTLHWKTLQIGKNGIESLYNLIININFISFFAIGIFTYTVAQKISKETMEDKLFMVLAYIGSFIALYFITKSICGKYITSIEVKNYNIETNQNALINNVVKQAEERATNLPTGMTQKVKIDIRGQSVSETQQKAIKEAIAKKSNGIIKADNIKFF